MFAFSVLVASDCPIEVQAATDCLNHKKEKLVAQYPVLKYVRFDVYTAKDTQQSDLTYCEPQPIGIKRMIECARKRAQHYNVPFPHTKSPLDKSPVRKADFFFAYENAVVKEDDMYAYDQAAIVFIPTVLNAIDCLTFSDRTYFPVVYYNKIVSGHHAPDLDTCGKLIAKDHPGVDHRDWQALFHPRGRSRLYQLTHPDELCYDYLEAVMASLAEKVQAMMVHIA